MPFVGLVHFVFFNNVLRILFAKNELLLLVTLYTYLYLNKTISDKDQRGLSTVLYVGTVRRCSVCACHGGTGTNKAAYVPKLMNT